MSHPASLHHWSNPFTSCLFLDSRLAHLTAVGGAATLTNNLADGLTEISAAADRESLTRAVCLYVLARFDTDEDITGFFRSLSRCGCVSGLVGDLIYYRDTHAFYDRHYDEIEELRCELEDSLGEPLTVNGDLKNYYAWLAFEETAFRLANELGLDL